MKLKKLLSTVVASMLFATAIAQVPYYVPGNGLTAWYSFSGNANDISGNGNNGTPIGAMLTTDRFGNANSAYSFLSGNQARIELNTTIMNFGTSDFTLSAWIYKQSTGGAIISKRNTPSHGNFVAFSAQLGAELDETGPGDYVGELQNPEVPLNTWTLATMVRQGSTIKLYNNGVLVHTITSGSTQSINNSAMAMIGARSDGTMLTQFFEGMIDDLGIWSSALSQQEIMGLYNNCTPTVTNVYEHVCGTSMLSPSGNYTWTTAGPHNDTLVTATGCDSVLIYNLTFGSALVDQAISVAYPNIICEGNAEIKLANTQQGVFYYLRDDMNDAVVEGPVRGTSTSITFAAHTNDTTTYNVYAAKGAALSLNGIDEYGTIIPGSGINSQFPANHITMEAWVNLNYNSGTPMVIGESYLGDGTVLFSIYQAGNTLIAGFFDGNWHSVSTPIPLNSWQHVAATYDQSQIILYINGMQVAAVNETAPLPPSFEEWRVGRRWDFPEVINGQLDEIRVWNVARTQAEIQAAMNACLTGSEPGLVIFYNFDGSGAGTDLAGGDHTATFVNVDATDFVPHLSNCDCTAEMTTKPTITTIPLAAPIPAMSSVVCDSGTAIINIPSSQTGVNYWLVDTINRVLIDGPIQGTGNALSFESDSISVTDTLYVLAAAPSTALRFDGSNDYIAVNGNLTALAGDASYTIEAWVKPDASVGISGIAGYGNYGTYDEVNAFRFQGPTTLVNYWWYHDLVVNTPNLADGNYHHVAATYDGTTRRIYVDGNLMGSDTPGSPNNITNTSNVTVASTNGGENFPGNMGEVRIWSTGRTQDDIIANMYTNFTGTEPGLLVNYTMQDGIGSAIASDLAGGDNNGMLMNMDSIEAWEMPCGILSQVIATVSHSTSSSLTQTSCDSLVLNNQTFNASGIYMQTLVNAAGCDSILTLDLTINNANASITANDPMLSANAAGATYQWVDCNNNYSPIAGETNQAFTAVVNGSYAVIVTENNCTDTSVCYMVTTVGIDSRTQNAFSIYPNPATSEVSMQISVASAQQAEIAFFTAEGQLVIAEKLSLSAGNNMKNFDLQQLSKGVYQVRITTTDQVIIKKLVLN
jgi:hypothetical protein